MVDSGDTGTSVIATDPSTLYNKDINHTGEHMTATTYNGWANWETWCASLWINNEEHLYRMARIYGHSGYAKLIPHLQVFGMKNGDDLAWDDAGIDHDEMDEMLEELCDTTGY